MALARILWRYTVSKLTKKYEFTDDVIQHKDKRLVRIRATRKIEIPLNGKLIKIKKGELGGYVPYDEYLPSPYHLQHDDNAWVSGNAKLIGGRMFHDSLLTGNAILINGFVDSSFIGENAVISGISTKLYFAKIFGNASVCDATVHGSFIFDNAQITGDVYIGESSVFESAAISVEVGCGKLKIQQSCIFGQSKIKIRSPNGFAANRSFNRASAFFKMNVSSCLIDSESALQVALRKGLIYKINADMQLIGDVAFPLKRCVRIPV